MFNSLKVKMKWSNGRKLVARKEALLDRYQKLGYSSSRGRCINNEMRWLDDVPVVEWSHTIHFGQTVYSINGLVRKGDFSCLSRACLHATLGIFSSARFSAGRMKSNIVRENGKIVDIVFNPHFQ
jgi:hypothetical protein